MDNLTTPQVIIFNGPPGSGKDTAVTSAWQKSQYPCVHLKMAEPLSDGICAMFGLSPGQWDDLYSRHKEEPSDHLYGMSPRQAMIWLSEDVIKPKFGKNFFGVIAARKVEWALRSGQYVLMSDGGFPDEVKEITKLVGGDCCHLVRIRRAGCDFSNDSREYLEPEDVDIPRDNYYSLLNYSSLVDFRQQITAVLNCIQENT